MQARFDGTEFGFGDFGDLSQAEIFQVMQEQNRTLRRRQLVDQGQKFNRLLLADKEVGGAIFPSLGWFGQLLDPILRPFTPALDDFLMGDAEEPAAKAVVLPQVAQMFDGRDEGFLEDIQAAGIIVGAVIDKSVER